MGHQVRRVAITSLGATPSFPFLQSCFDDYSHFYRQVPHTSSMSSQDPSVPALARAPPESSCNMTSSSHFLSPRPEMSDWPQGTLAIPPPSMSLLRYKDSNARLELLVTSMPPSQRAPASEGPPPPNEHNGAEEELEVISIKMEPLFLIGCHTNKVSNNGTK